MKVARRAMGRSIANAAMTRRAAISDTLMLTVLARLLEKRVGVMSVACATIVYVPECSEGSINDCAMPCAMAAGCGGMLCCGMYRTMLTPTAGVVRMRWCEAVVVCRSGDGGVV